MKKILIIGIVFVGLFLVFTQVFGAVVYERTPSGVEITSPVHISVSGDTIEDLGFTEEIDFWGITLFPEEGENFYSTCNPLSNLTLNYSFDIPVGTKIVGIEAAGVIGTQEECEEYGGNPGIWLEYDDENILFTIILSSFVEISLNFVTSTLAYIGQAVSGLGPLLYFVIGAPVAFWVIRKIIGLVPKR